MAKIENKMLIFRLGEECYSANSYVYVIGAFENGSTIKNYYLRINDGKMKKIDRYEEVELVEGTNKIELSKDGVNILKRIVVERDK